MRSGYSPGCGNICEDKMKAGRKLGSKNKQQAPVRYKHDYIDLMALILLKDKQVDGEMWRDYKKVDTHQASLKGNVSSFDVAVWASQWLVDREPKEVEVQLLSGKKEVMSMDKFKELIGGLNDYTNRNLVATTTQ